MTIARLQIRPLNPLSARISYDCSRWMLISSNCCQKRLESDRGCEFLNRPYELSDLMRQATAAVFGRANRM